MKRHGILAVCVFFLGLSFLAGAEQTAFDGVEARFSKSDTDRRFIEKDSELILDDGAQKLMVKNDEHPLEVSYNDIQKVVFDVSTHRRGANWVFAVSPVVGEARAGKHVSDHWCYLEYKRPDASVQSYLLEIPEKWSQNVIDKMQASLGGNVTIAEFPEKEESINKNTLKDVHSKYDVKVEKDTHPLPVMKPGKALVVVVCSAPTARFYQKGLDAKLHANDNVVAVNNEGTYAFAYLGPGEYLLVSQPGDASGLRMKLEAGKDYYFLEVQDAVNRRTTLSRHSKELIMYEISGAYYSDWKPK
jgi:hypothetical protein